MNKILKRKFTLDDQNEFARLSGDYNPLHVDIIKARRLVFGDIAVHGIHSLIWAVDHWLEDKKHPVKILSLKSVFIRAISLNQELQYFLISDQNNICEIELKQGEILVTKIKINWEYSSDKQDDRFLLFNYPPKHVPNTLTIEEIKDKNGEIDLYINTQEIKNLFPNISLRLSTLQTSVIINTTRLVGMECPG